MNDRVAAYRDLVELIAEEVAPRSGRGRNGIEWDDAVQEGLLAVWQTLARGHTPAIWMIKNRMIDYRRWLGRTKVIPYEAMLPLDDYMNLTPNETGVGAGS